ncbi:Niban-like protein 1, partial [Eschrichtius robustus]|nr:Niban-like protein 1 [Eschrichtius robustus]
MLRLPAACLPSTQSEAHALFADPLASTGEVGKLIWATTATINDKSEKWYFQSPGCTAVSKADPGQQEPFVAAVTNKVRRGARWGLLPGPAFTVHTVVPAAPQVGIPEDSKVEGPAFTDAIRMYRQCKELYGTWEMLCGNEVQILSNLVMEELGPELKAELAPRLKGKPQERQRQWIQISDTVYRMVYEQAKARFEAVLSKLQLARPAMEAVIRTDMDQIITSKEHLASKIRASILPKAEVCVRNHVQPYIPSILEALMVPTSQGFTEVRDVFFKEVTDMNLNVINEGGIDKLGEYMEKLSQLAYHPLKMQSCYEKMEPLRLDGLQQRFDVSSTSVFKQRAQILMREQMDNAVYTFETLLHQELGKGPTKEELCKSIQRILERVLKKYDYDSSTVRKRFFREALLQITIPFLLKKLAPTCKSELSRFQELIFEDFARFILVENTYEEVVLQTVMKDILQDSITELHGLLARDQQAESPPLAGPLLNGAPAQESPQPGAAPEAASPPASPLRQLPPGKASDLEPPKPSDQETGEQVSGPGGRPPIHTTTEDGAGVQTEF